MQTEVERIKGGGGGPAAGGHHTRNGEETQRVLKNLYEEIMALVEDDNSLRKQIG